MSESIFYLQGSFVYNNIGCTFKFIHCFNLISSLNKEITPKYAKTNFDKIQKHILLISLSEYFLRFVFNSLKIFFSRLFLF